MARIRIENGWETWFTGPVRQVLEQEVLPAFLPGQRWFAGKARKLESVRIVDATPSGTLPAELVLVIAEARFRDGGSDLYFIPLDVIGTEEATEARELLQLEGPGGERRVVDALRSDSACQVLLDLIERGGSIDTASGSIRGVPTEVFAEARGATEAAQPIRRGSAEQSNSAVLYGSRLIMKVFRRLEPGLNPDFEIGRFLSERTDFGQIPRAAGAIEYDRPDSEPITLAILQGLVRNQGTGWEHALEELSAYFARVANRAETPEPAGAAEAIGPYLESAATLGRRTAELHRALASRDDDPAFAPEPLGEPDLTLLADDTREQVHKALETLRFNFDRLPTETGDQARRILAEVPALLGPLNELPTLETAATKTRVHGDYHLGQVLRVDGEDFVILDFEGEPARPLVRRREKLSPLKDVVGMLRSFDYAAYAGLFAATADQPDEFERLAPWARAWQSGTSEAFLRSYREVASGASFLPAEPANEARLLRAYTLDKALYELLYELNNRPDWVRIPLQGILSLIEPPHASGAAGPASE